MTAEAETLPALLRSLLRRGPQQPFLTDGVPEKGATVLSRGDFAGMVQELAARYRRASVVAGDRVAIYLERGVHQAAAFLAASQVGAIAVCLNEKLKDRQVQHILSDCEPALVVSSTIKLGLLLQPAEVLAGRRQLLLDDGPVVAASEVDADPDFGGGGFPYTIYVDADNNVVARSSGELDPAMIENLWNLAASAPGTE